MSPAWSEGLSFVHQVPHAAVYAHGIAYRDRFQPESLPARSPRRIRAENLVSRSAPEQIALAVARAHGSLPTLTRPCFSSCAAPAAGLVTRRTANRVAAAPSLTRQLKH